MGFTGRGQNKQALSADWEIYPQDGNGGYILRFAGNAAVPNEYEANSSSFPVIAVGSSIGGSEVVVPLAGTIVGLLFSSDNADGTTTYRIHRNGVAVGLGAFVGNIGGNPGYVVGGALGAITVVAGDRLEVLHIAGTAPGNGTISVHIQ